MTDMFLLLLLPAAGDDLQGIKRGIMELADLVIVNKSDGALETAAMRTAADYAQALRLMQPRHRAWTAEVLRCSSLNGQGIAEIAAKTEAFRKALGKTGELAGHRRAQAGLWFQRELSLSTLERLAEDPDLAKLLAEQENRVAKGKASPAGAARQIVDRLLSARNSRDK
jgi:LAO/AO transport system kinase